MVHSLFLLEGYHDSISKFLEYFHGKTYANGKAKVRARVILPIHFGINEVGYDEFLADLKSFTCNHKFKTKHKNSIKDTENTGQGLKNKIRKYSKWFRKIFPQIQDIGQDFEKVNNNELRKKLGKKGQHFIIGLYPIGKVKDARYPDGSEIV